MIITGSTIAKLERQINSWLEDGYELAGGVTTQIYYNDTKIAPNYENSVVLSSGSSYTINYLQAIYKPKSKELS